jgi:hypothetical protein
MMIVSGPGLRVELRPERTGNAVLRLSDEAGIEAVIAFAAIIAKARIAGRRRTRVTRPVCRTVLREPVGLVSTLVGVVSG